MATRKFLSTDDQFGRTELELELETASVKSVVSIRNGVRRTLLNCLGGSLFTIRFTRHDLMNPGNNVDPDNRFNDHPFGAIEYSIGAGLADPMSQANADSLSFVYTGLPASSVLPPTATNPPLPPLTEFDRIDVTLTFSRSSIVNDKGWIDFDIRFTYPEVITNHSTSIAWETRLLYPQIHFKNDAVVDDMPLTAHELLFPTGPLGSLAAIHDTLPNPLVGDVNVQYSALFKRTSGTDRINSVSGLAFSGTDEIGQRKSVSYQRINSTSAMGCLLHLPIHLIGLPPAFVRPTAIPPDKAFFTLSGGDANGFRGALMKFRLRAFQVDGVCPDARVGWTDAASVYRSWLMTRQPSFFNKPVRTTHGPIDKLSPHTVISNYSIDGQAIGRDRGRDVDKWLEVHPAKDGQSDTGTLNDSLQDVLVRVRQTMETQTDWVTANESEFLASPPAASSRQPNLIDLFARSKGGKLLHSGCNGNVWVGWENLSSSSDTLIKDTPASASWDKNRIDVFARGANDRLLHKGWVSGPGWTPQWEDLGQPSTTPVVTVASSPAVASRGVGRLDCFVRGSDGAIWHREVQNAAWKAWESSWDKPAPGIASAPAAVAWSAGRVDCLVRGNDDALYLRSLTPDGLRKWFPVGKPQGVNLTADPAITSWASNRLDVFAWGTDNGLWHKCYNGGSLWTDWERLGDTKSSPAAVSWGLHRVDCFMLDGQTVKYKWLDQDASIEAQIWGHEMGGTYHYLGGYPPATNVISGDPNRFRNALDALNSLRIVPTITTDPLAPLFNRGRYRGHVIRNADGSWDECIQVGFPKLIEEYKQVHGAGAITVLKLAGEHPPPDNNRVFLVKDNDAFAVQPNVPDAKTLADSYHRYDPGGPGEWTGALSNRLYDARMRPICLTREVADLYLTKWVPEVFKNGARLVEFMKVFWGGLGCYNKDHKHHLFSLPSPPGEYDNVMGHGAWYIQRLKDTWQQLQQKGRGADPSLNKSADPAFALTCEHAPYEMLLPYVDEFYHRSLLFQYLYSSKISAKMDLGDIESVHLHPGYKETRVPGEPLPIFMITEDAEAPPNFDEWKDRSNEIAPCYNITPGLAPVGYPTYNKRAAEGTYTYQRCVQNYFNLRSNIFKIGLGAVLGERILFSSTWLEPPNEYLAEVIAFAVRAAKLHLTFKEFFREGYWLGQTAITQGQKLLWAYDAPFRVFPDVDPLVRKVYKEELALLPGADPKKLTVGISIADFISRATDTETISPLNSDPDSPGGVPGASLVSSEKIQHNIWQLDGFFGRELLYLFANVGNIDANAVEFQYSKGLDQTPVNAPWKRTLYAFTGDGRNAPVTSNIPAEVVLGQSETVSMPKRSLLAVRLTR